MDDYSAAEPLAAHHNVEQFDCGKAELDQYLKKYALSNHLAGAARTFVVSRRNRVVAYYALAAASVGPDDVPARVGKGLARHPVPVFLLARLAVDTREQGRGIGGAILKDAMVRAAGAAEVIGARALLVHAKDQESLSFYERFDFEPSPTDPLHLFLLMKDLRSALG